MKKLLLLSALAIVGMMAKANDLIVEEGGLLPSYDSITSAVRAANSGDRIFIKNKASGLPWLENIILTKSVSLLAYTADSFFIVQGTYTFIPATPDTTIIIGMINLNGSITTNAAPVGARSVVRILDGQFNSGSIIFGTPNYDLTVEGCSIAGGYIEYEHGSIVGNTISNSSNSYGIWVVGETTVTTDTSYIFGNEIGCSYTGAAGIEWSSSTMNFDIRNNFVTSPYYGILIDPTIGNGIALNKVYNNTISIINVTQPTSYGIYVIGGTSSSIDVENNIVDRNSVSVGPLYYGIDANYGSGGNLTLAYNYVDDNFSTAILGTITVNLDNNVSSAITVSGTGVANVGVNAGNPAVQFYNTNLTPNTVGCYGGSYTLNNFFPLFTTAPTTWLTNYNFNIRTGNTLSIKANSYSR